MQIHWHDDDTRLAFRTLFRTALDQPRPTQDLQNAIQELLYLTEHELALDKPLAER